MSIAGGLVVLVGGGEFPVRGASRLAAAIRISPLMIAVAVACLPIFLTGNRIARWEGGLFLYYYAACTTYLVLDAVVSAFRRTLAGGLLVFVVSLTVLTFAVAVLGGLRQREVVPGAKRR